MKRVLIFSLAYYPRFVGGAEVAVKEITDRISREEIEFHMVTLRFDSALPPHERIGNVVVHRIGFTRPAPTVADLKTFPLYLNKILFQVAAALAGASLHRRYHFDATWALMAHSAGIPALLFKWTHPGIPYLLTLQEGDPPEDIERTMRPARFLFDRAFKKANRVQAISTFLGEWARWRGYEGPLEIIPNGVDTEHFSKTYAPAVVADLRRKLGHHRGDVFLITTSRLVHKNGVDVVIRSLSYMHRVFLLILGVGPDEEKLRTLARELGVEERVRFLGHVDHVDLPKYLKASDIFVRPSRSEGMGNSFIEAFAAGIPVIATQEGGIADFLFDTERNIDQPATGFAVDKDDAKQIADKVRQITGNPALARQVVQNARELALARYDWNRVAREMKERVFGPLMR